MNQSRSEQKLVPAVERGAEILDIVAESKRFLTVSELARETGLAKSTVHNLCMTLTHLGLLIRRPDQSYSLGPHLLRWSNAFERQTDVATEFSLLLDQIDVTADVIVTLTVPEQSEIVFIAVRQTIALPRFPARPGRRLPAASSAAGLAILACLSDFEIQRLFHDGLPLPLTKQSVRDMGALVQTIADARAKGYALESEQSYEGITSVAAPVLNSHNKPVAAVMLSAPSELWSEDNSRQWIILIQTVAARLSRRLGAFKIES